MAQAKTAGNKKGVQRVRMINGQVVKPCLFNGRANGNGKYMAAVDSAGNLVMNPETGRPYAYRDGELTTPVTA